MTEPIDNKDELDLKANEVEQEKPATDKESAEPADLSFLDGKADDAKESEKQKVLDGQIRAAKTEYLLDGKPVEDFPPYIQKELLKLKPLEQPKVESQDVDIDALLDQKLKQRDDATSFNQLKSNLQLMDLSDVQANDLKIQFESLRSNGLQDKAALETAIQLTGLTQEAVEAEKKQSRFNSLAIPSQGRPRVTEKKPDLMEMNDDDFLKASNDLAK